MRHKTKKASNAKETPLEEAVERIMGPTMDKAGATKDKNEDEETPSERLLVIPDSDSSKSNKPTAPPVAGATEASEPADMPAKAAPAEEPADDTLPDVDDDATDKAVDDIARTDGDTLLAVQDATEPAEPPNKGHKFRRFFKAWWHNKVARWATIFLILAGIGTAIGMPTSRYAILNTAGVRASASITIIDDTTQLPLKNVQVSLAGQTALTSKDGTAHFYQLKLGKTTLTISKRAFATISQPHVIGWGSNPLENIMLHAVGLKYTFHITDFLSGKPITTAEASLGEASALADQNGKIVLALDNSDISQTPVTISADGFRDEKVPLGPANTSDQTVKMVPARKLAFISKRSGTYDVYKIDADGNNEAVVLKGTGLERDDISLVAHPSDDKVALVSSRENVHNADGFLLNTLTLIDLSDGTTTKVAQSERIQVMGWIGSRLVYVQEAAGASANNPQRQQIFTYDYKTNNRTQISVSNSYNDIAVAGSNIFYAPSSQTAQDAGSLIKSNAEGTNKQTIIDSPVWNIYRSAYDQLTLAVQQNWYQYKLGDTKAQPLSSPPANLVNRLYADSPDGRRSAWVDQRDGKGVLLVYDVGAKKETTAQTMDGLTTPVHWLTNNTIVFRVHNDNEIADYVVNIDGGAARKIRDVTDAKGVDRWLYY